MKVSKPVFFIAILLLLANMAVLTKYILFKQQRDVSFQGLTRIARHRPHARQAGHENWVLFASIRKIYNSRQSPEYKWQNIGGNILGFVPLGFLFPLTIFRRRQLLLTVSAVFGISLGFEVTQLYTDLGVFDVDDLLLNTAGGVLGYIIYLIAIVLMQHRLPRNSGVRHSFS